MLPLYFDLGATLLFGLSGALLAARRGHDLVGLFVVALATGVGGGLLRDGLFLRQGPPACVQDGSYLLVLSASRPTSRRPHACPRGRLRCRRHRQNSPRRPRSPCASSPWPAPVVRLTTRPTGGVLTLLRPASVVAALLGPIAMCLLIPRLAATPRSRLPSRPGPRQSLPAARSPLLPGPLRTHPRAQILT